VHPLVSRLALALLGGAAGAFAGAVTQAPQGAWTGGFAGLAAALVAVGARDLLRGARLMAWLRGTRESGAPRDGGFWGEIAYRVEKALRALERGAEGERERLQQFVQAMDAAPNGVLLLGPDDTIEWINARAAEHFGLDPVRDRRQRVTNLVRVPAFVEYLRAGRFDEPVPVRRPGGRGTLSVLARRHGAGSTLVVSEDLAERERADAMRRDFVANVSHEIRTPLAVLSGFLETLRTLPLDAGERDRVLALMTEQADRMTTLVGDLLTLATLEGSPRPSGERRVALAPLLRAAGAEAAGLSEARKGRHAIAIDADGAAASVDIAGDERELLSAVANLLSNAVRYTPEGGTISVAWQPQADGGGRIAVADSGPGIPREHLPRLAERFYRVDSGRSRETGGTGLGLAIVKHVVERHGGELDIASEVGRGSTFALRFPPTRVRARASTEDQGVPA
jgi:two-component system phosphate regulon sensor histidine kinase PhoR